MWLLVLILVLFAVGAFPAWPHAHDWGYAPSSLFTVLVIIGVVLLLTKRL